MSNIHPWIVGMWLSNALFVGYRIGTQEWGWAAFSAVAVVLQFVAYVVEWHQLRHRRIKWSDIKRVEVFG